MQDANHERMLYCLKSLIGQRLTVQVHNNVTYEGTLDKFTLEGDARLTLSRVSSSDGKDRQEPLVLSSKDFLQVSALDVLPLEKRGAASSAPSRFKTDGQIADSKRPGRERDLVAWSESDEKAGQKARSGGNLQLDRVRPGAWDQFKANEEQFGVTSTYDEDLYTTKLDPSTIPAHKRREAEQIARAIETGQSYARFEEGLEGEDDDEEARFSAVAAPKVPLTQENMSQHDARHMKEQLQSGDDAFAREHRTKRYMITAHSPMRTPMISEMKRINALNLEPALPKLDDRTRNDWIVFKQARARQGPQGDLRSELQQSLQAFQQKDVERQTKPHEEGAYPGSSEPGGGFQQQAEASADDMAQKSLSSKPEEETNFMFNPSAKEFSFNAQAASFTPTGAGQAAGAEGSAKGSRPQSGAPASQAQAASRSPMTGQGPAKPSRPFVVPKLSASKRSLAEMFSRYAGSVVGNAQKESPHWDTTKNFFFRDVLGKMSAGSPQVPGLQQLQQQMLQQTQVQQQQPPPMPPPQMQQHQQQPPPMQQSQMHQSQQPHPCMAQPSSMNQQSMNQQIGPQGYWMAMPGQQQQQQQMFQQMPGRASGPPGPPRPNGPQSVQGPHGHMPPQHGNMGAGMNNAMPKFGGNQMMLMMMQEPGGQQQFPGQGFMAPQGAMQGGAGTMQQGSQMMQGGC